MSITVGVKKFTVSTKMSPFLMESRFQNLEIFLGAIRNTEPVLRNPSNDWIPEHKCHL